MKRYGWLIVAFLLAGNCLIKAQTLDGKLLIVGGGSENYNNWSDAPYAWAVEQSANKRVAIVGTASSPSSWLPDYFMWLGADYAKNFPVTSGAQANEQALYDSLTGYDVIFFRGGNQWNYYNHYRNTLLQQAVVEVFMSGGVIGGTSAGLHILSEVLFTAQNGTVYPDEALADPFNPYMTLKDDFLPFMNGYIFDSHFVERARFGRLLGFLGHWNLAEGADIVGIGVDDKTALCIDSDGVATVYGTGAVNVYKAGAQNEYSLSDTKLLATDVDVMQLLHECTVDFNDFTFTGLPQQIVPALPGETFSRKLWLSASDLLNPNQQMLQQLVEHMAADDTILLVTANSNIANIYANYIEQQGGQVQLLLTDAANGEDSGWLHKINKANLVLFAGNVYEPLMDFMHETTNGAQLLDQLYSGLKDAAFVGGDSRFAGKSVVINYTQAYASYDGLLQTGPGLALLQNTAVMPNTFSSSIDNENAASGLPYLMVNDSLRYGIWLHHDSFAHYSTSDNTIELTSYGDFPMIFMENEGTWGGLSTQSAVSSGLPRNVAGFGSFRLSLMDETMMQQISLVSKTAEIPTRQPWLIYPNPTADAFRINGLPEGEYAIWIMDSKGRVVQKVNGSEKMNIAVNNLNRGLYFVTVIDNSGSHAATRKLIIQ